MKVCVSAEVKPRFSVDRKSVGYITPSCPPWRYQFTKFLLASRSVLQTLWTTVVLYGCKFSSFVEFRADYAGMQFWNDKIIFCLFCGRNKRTDLKSFAVRSIRKDQMKVLEVVSACSMHSRYGEYGGKKWSKNRVARRRIVLKSI